MDKEEWIISGILKGDRKEKKKAISFLYKKCFPAVRTWVLRGGTEEQAEDIFQEGISLMYDNLMEDRFKRNSLLSTYLTGICKILWLNELKKVKITYQSEMVVDIPEEVDISFDDKYLLELQSELGPDCKGILGAFYYERNTMEEIKVQFGLGSEQAAKTKKYRCIKRLMQLIKDRGLTYESFTK